MCGATGHITASTYFQSIDSDVNCRCVAKVKQRFGENTVTDKCWEAAYLQTDLLASALAVVGSDNIQQLVSTLRGMEFVASQGVVVDGIGLEASTHGLLQACHATRQ